MLGDVADPVGDESGAGGKKGDVLVGIDGSTGRERGRIVFEAKDKQLSKPKFYADLDDSMEQRESDYAVLVVPTAGEVPAKLHSMREYQGDKMIAVFDAEAGSTLELEFAYRVRPRACDGPARGCGRDRRRGHPRDGGPGGRRDGRRPQDQVTAHHGAERHRRSAGDARRSRRVRRRERAGARDSLPSTNGLRLAVRSRPAGRPRTRTADRTGG